LLYDTIRSDDPSDFVGAAVCIESNGVDLATTDFDPLAAGVAVYYLVRAENGCGDGFLGIDPFDQPRTAISCP
jgi:hypothetical protein